MVVKLVKIPTPCHRTQAPGQMLLNYSYAGRNMSKLTNLPLLSRGLSIQLLQIVNRAWPAHKTIPSAIVMAGLEIPPLQRPTNRLLALSGLSNGCSSCSGNQSVSSSADLAFSSRRVVEFSLEEFKVFLFFSPTCHRAAQSQLPWKSRIKKM